MAFSKKIIEVVFELANGSFEGGGNTYTAAGLRISCSVEVKGGAYQGNARIAIFGLPLQIMNQLSNVGPKWAQAQPNFVTIKAGDEASGVQIVWQGGIYAAMVDATAMPHVVFLIEARPGYFGQIKSATPLSIKGSASVSTMMEQISNGLGMTFENNGVVKKIANAYYSGSLVNQAQQIARDAGINWIMDRNTLAIANPGEPRQGAIPLISPQTGLIAYPLFNQNQIILKAMYNPNVQFMGQIEVKSDITPANGKWLVTSLTYELECEMPKGKWHMDIIGIVQGNTVAGG